MTSAPSRLVRVPSADDEKTHCTGDEEKKEDDPSRWITTTSHSHSSAGTTSFLSRTDEFGVLENHLTSRSNTQLRQNSGIPRYQHIIDLSPVATLASSENQRDDPLHSFLSRVSLNFSVSNQSPSIIVNGQGVVNATAESVGQSRDLQQPQVSISSSNRASVPSNAQSNSDQTSEQGTTIGTRLRNIFNQFLNRFISLS